MRRIGNSFGGRKTEFPPQADGPGGEQPILWHNHEISTPITGSGNSSCASVTRARSFKDYFPQLPLEHQRCHPRLGAHPRESNITISTPGGAIGRSRSLTPARHPDGRPHQTRPAVHQGKHFPAHLRRRPHEQQHRRIRAPSTKKRAGSSRSPPCNLRAGSGIWTSRGTT